MTRNIGKTTKRLLALLGLAVLTLALCACKLGDIPTTTTDGTQATGDPASTTAAVVPDTSVPDTSVPETTEAQLQTYWIFAHGGLRVRSGPGTGFEMVGSLEEGDWVTPLKWENGWAYIEEPVKGWCSGEFLHKLGWYKDVKTPEGRTLEDKSLIGKWVHTTQVTQVNGQDVCRAGIYRLRGNGTFLHQVADYRKNPEGKWELVPGSAQPYWVGEYQYDGKTLTLDYMARLETTYDSKGEPVTREWVAAVSAVKVGAEKSSDGYTVTFSDGALIPLNDSFGTDAATLQTLCRAANNLPTPQDVAAILDKLFS